MRKKVIGYYFLAIFCSLTVASFYYFNTVKNSAAQYCISTLIATLLSLPLALFAANIVIDNYLKINWRPTMLGTIIGGISSFIYTIIILISLEQQWINNNGVSYGMNIPWYLILLTLIIGFSAGIVIGVYTATIGFITIVVSIVTGSIVGAFSQGVTGIVMSVGGSFLGSSSLFSILIALKALFHNAKAQQSRDLLSLAPRKIAPEIKALLDLAKRENDVLTKTKVVMELEITPEVADEILKYAELNSLCQSYLDEDNGLIKYKFNF